MKKILNCIGFTLIEVMVAISISSVLLSGVIIAFQSFTSFDTWMIRHTHLQKNSLQEIIVFEKAFEGEKSFFDILDVSAFIKNILAREDDSLVFNYASAVKSQDSGEQIEFTDESGYFALHSGVLFGGMVKVNNSLYIVDTGYHVIRRLNLDTEVEEIYSGSLGVAGNNNGDKASATFRNPTGITYYDGKLYIVDTGNHVVRLINTANGVVSDYAGVSGKSGNTEGLKDKSYFNHPTSITVNTNNGDFYISDTGNHIIKKISGGIVRNILGSYFPGYTSDYAESANFSDFSLNTPINLIFDEKMAHLYINDFKNKRILRLREGYDVANITDQNKYFGGLAINEDSLGKRYIEYQELLTGDIYGIETIDLGVINVLSEESFEGYDGEAYLNHSFVRNGDDLIIWGIKKSNNTWQLMKLQNSTSTTVFLYGDGGNIGQMNIWDEKAYIFDFYLDYIGKSKITNLEIRNNPTSYNTNLKEALITFEIGDDKEEMVELNYSVLLGRNKNTNI